MEMEFDVKITGGILYDFLMYHNYSKISNLIVNIIGAFILTGGIVNKHIPFIICGIILLLYLPVSLFVKAKQQQLLSPAFKKPLHYRLTAEGVFVSQDGQEEMQEWNNMYKAVSTPKSIILYTTRVNACIFPRKDLGTDVPKLMEIISVNMDPKKVKIRGYL
ncbi:MAG: YcxB family protein [Lachnospiraceae bacterium]|nr:YcxB family protein [Lachnospiraceae bacterium]